MHKVHGLLVGGVAGIALGLASMTGTTLAEPVSIPTAEAGIVAPRCMVGQPCTFAAPIFACDYASAEKIVRAGPLNGRTLGLSLLDTKTCQTVPAGRPVTTEATRAPQVVYLTEGGQHLGYMPVGVFAPPAPASAAPAATALAPANPVATMEPDKPVPFVNVTRLSAITLNLGRAPFGRAVALAGQGTATATVVFRVGPAERRTFCADYAGSDADAMRGCFADFPDQDVRARANCPNRTVTVFNRSYRLEARPATAAPDMHVDPQRRWLWRDAAGGDRLDGTTASGESTVDGAFDALCPGSRPGAERGVVYRDPQASYPRELWGRWFDSRQACADPGHDAPDYDEQGVMTIAAKERGGNRDFEFPQRVNAVRRVGPKSWQIDGSHRIDTQDVPEIFGTATYTLTRDGLALTREGETSKWVKCR